MTVAADGDGDEQRPRPLQALRLVGVCVVRLDPVRDLGPPGGDPLDRAADERPAARLRREADGAGPSVSALVERHVDGVAGPNAARHLDPRDVVAQADVVAAEEIHGVDRDRSERHLVAARQRALVQPDECDHRESLDRDDEPEGDAARARHCTILAASLARLRSSANASPISRRPAPRNAVERESSSHERSTKRAKTSMVTTASPEVASHSSSRRYPTTTAPSATAISSRLNSTVEARGAGGASAVTTPRTATASRASSSQVAEARPRVTRSDAPPTSATIASTTTIRVIPPPISSPSTSWWRSPKVRTK